MSLSAGVRLGPYEIVAPLGAGGMGEVYRARDTKLDREAAIKVLPEVFAADYERLARVEREAKLLATLNHSSIAAIYGLEKAAGKFLHFVHKDPYSAKARGISAHQLFNNPDECRVGCRQFVAQGQIVKGKVENRCR